MTSRVGNFKSILDLNLLTRLKYLSWIFWLNSNTWVKNSDLNRVLTSWVLNLNSDTWLDAISLVSFSSLMIMSLMIIQKEQKAMNWSVEFTDDQTFISMFNTSYETVTYAHVSSFLNNELKNNYVLFQFLNVVNIRLIIESSFELTFWTQINVESSCSHFQLNSSRVAHIFNLTRFDSTENWVNSTRLAKNSSLTSRELNIEIFPAFALSFCIIFLVESHEGETWRPFGRESWRET